MYCGYIRETGQLLLGLPYPISLPHQSTVNLSVSSLSATKVTTLWLKQSTCFCSDIYNYLSLPLSCWLMQHPSWCVLEKIPVCQTVCNLVHGELNLMDLPTRLVTLQSCTW